MKAVRISEFGGPEVLNLVDVKEPSPNKGEVRVKLFTIGLNPSESYTISGTYAYNIPKLPYIPGSDGAGIVEEIGERVENVKVGDRVYVCAINDKRNTGTYAEKVVMDAKSVFHLPAEMSFEQGAALGVPVFTAYRALIQKAKIRAGEVVLIHGASGAVGTIAVQIAKSVGAIVIGTSSTEQGRETVLNLGADFAIPHVTEENKDQLLELTNGKGPDVIIEFLADVNLEIDTKIITAYGRIVIVGSRGTIKFTPRNIMSTDASVTGMSFINLRKDEAKEMYHGVKALVAKGLVKPVIGRKFNLNEIREAHKHLMGSSGDGRTIIEIIK